MKDSSVWIYIILMVLATNFIRILPVTLIRKKITNKFIRSFLYYVPYVTLAVMTVPAILDATASPLIGFIALLIGIAAAWIGFGLLPVALLCCSCVFLLNYLLPLIS